MSTDEQDREIGKAHRRRKAARQELQCLTLKAGRLAEAIRPVLKHLQTDPAVHVHDLLTTGQMHAYPDRKEVLQTIADLQALKAEIAQLDKLLS